MGEVHIQQGDKGLDRSTTNVDNSSHVSNTSNVHDESQTTTTNTSNTSTSTTTSTTQTDGSTKVGSVGGDYVQGTVVRGTVVHGDIVHHDSVKPALVGGGLVLSAVLVVGWLFLARGMLPGASPGKADSTAGVPAATPGSASAAAEGMVTVPAGEVQSGSLVLRVPAGFLIDEHEVTNEEYAAFVSTHRDWRKGSGASSNYDADYLRLWNGSSYPVDRARHPVVYVSWHAAQAYCAAVGKRLPTEREWEFAARAGSSAAYWWGDAFSGANANNNGVATEAVDQPSRRNRFGLADMAGNVWEWTSSAGDSRAGSVTQIVRGGSWKDPERFLRSDARESLNPEVTGPDLGFRCAK